MMSASQKQQIDEASKHAVLDAFEQLYHELNAETVSLERLAVVYDEDMVFEDAFHKIDGLHAFYDYCVSLYENVGDICFDFERRWLDGDDAVLQWRMYYQHPRLKRGKTIEVAGVTYLKLGDRVLQHRDYFDGGQLLYEHIPLLGTVISQLKKRLA